MDNFERATNTNAFNYIYEKTLAPNDVILLKMPVVSSNKRGFNDIGWQASGDVDLYGTLERKPKIDSELWQKIEPYDEVNKTIAFLKIVNGSEKCRIVIRALLN